MGEDCYKDKAVYVNASVSECPTHSYCEMYRHNSTCYEARCGDHCIHHYCPKNGTSMDQCSIFCCNTSTGSCLTLENIIQSGGMNNTTTWMASTIIPTTTTTPSTTTIAYSDKLCRSIKCAGLDCYKSYATEAPKKCQVGRTHCELQKIVSGTSVSYEGGCSNTCATSTKSCASITNANCFQECCNSTNTACCMKLDGQVHFNTASRLTLSSFLKISSYAFIVILSTRSFSFFRV
ncbi:uncharacterized protein RCH25_043914 [Pelodytes ibericus]